MKNDFTLCIIFTHENQRCFSEYINDVLVIRYDRLHCRDYTSKLTTRTVANSIVFMLVFVGVERIVMSH